MNTIEGYQEEIIDDFSAIDDWMDRYAMIIDMGNALPPIDNALKTPDRLSTDARAVYGSTPAPTARDTSISPPIPTP